MYFAINHFRVRRDGEERENMVLVVSTVLRSRDCQPRVFAIDGKSARRLLPAPSLGSMLNTPEVDIAMVPCHCSS
jgi:hypothetical protein